MLKKIIFAKGDIEFSQLGIFTLVSQHGINCQLAEILSPHDKFQKQIGLSIEECGHPAEARDDIFVICQLEDQDYRDPFSHLRFIMKNHD